MHTYLVATLECPSCDAELDWRIAVCSESRIQAARRSVLLAETELEWCVLVANG